MPCENAMKHRKSWIFFSKLPVSFFEVYPKKPILPSRSQLGVSHERSHPPPLALEINVVLLRPLTKPARACSQAMTDERKCSVGTMVDLSLLAFLISCSSTHMTNSILVITETLSVSASFLIRPQSSLQSFILCLSVYKGFV